MHRTLSGGRKTTLAMPDNVAEPTAKLSAEEQASLQALLKKMNG